MKHFGSPPAPAEGANAACQNSFGFFFPIKHQPGSRCISRSETRGWGLGNTLRGLDPFPPAKKYLESLYFQVFPRKGDV